MPVLPKTQGHTVMLGISLPARPRLSPAPDHSSLGLFDPLARQLSSALPCPPPPFTTAPVHSPSPWETQRSLHLTVLMLRLRLQGPACPWRLVGGWALGILGEILETVLLLLSSTLPFLLSTCAPSPLLSEMFRETGMKQRSYLLLPAPALNPRPRHAV